jgi:hypothetical protein
MAERKDKMSDEETLKHYKPEEGFPTPDAESELPAAAKEPLEKARASKPEFVKAEIAVDPIMTNRQSPVLQPEKNEEEKQVANKSDEKKVVYLSDEETLKHVTAFDAPPEGFDPNVADDRLLLRHGIPRRPHAQREPLLRKLWDSAFASKPRFIKAEIAIDPIMSKRRRPVLDKRVESLDFSPSGWAGDVVLVSTKNYNPPEPVNTVYGEWFIPNVTPVSNEPAGNQTVGFWVGIDGFTNGQVLQAGSAATVNGNNVTNWVWTEWFPLGAIQVTNFPIKPGDYLTVLVCAPQPDHGYCSMLNKTTNQATSIGITPPGGVTNIGASAEWIVEGISSVLPVFSTVVFQNCSAGTKDHAFNAEGGTITEITGSGGANLTSAAILSDNKVVVKWLKAS